MFFDKFEKMFKKVRMTDKFQIKPLREIQEESIARSILGVALMVTEGGSSDDHRKNALTHANEIARRAMSAGLTLSDINSLQEKTYEAVFALIEAAENKRPSE